MTAMAAVAIALCLAAVSAVSAVSHVGLQVVCIQEHANLTGGMLHLVKTQTSNAEAYISSMDNGTSSIAGSVAGVTSLFGATLQSYPGWILEARYFSSMNAYRSYQVLMGTSMSADATSSIQGQYTWTFGQDMSGADSMSTTYMEQDASIGFVFNSGVEFIAETAGRPSMCGPGPLAVTPEDAVAPIAFVFNASLTDLVVDYPITMALLANLYMEQLPCVISFTSALLTLPLGVSNQMHQGILLASSWECLQQALLQPQDAGIMAAAFNWLASIKQMDITLMGTQLTYDKTQETIRGLRNQRSGFRTQGRLSVASENIDFGFMVNSPVDINDDSPAVQLVTCPPHRTPMTSVLAGSATSCADGGPTNLTIDAMVGRWSGTCRTLGYNTGPDFTRCMPSGYTLEFHLDVEFFANASGLQWDHPTSVVLPNGTAIVRPEQLYPPGLLRSVTLSPLQDLTNAISACATLDLGFAQPKVLYRMACDTGSISGVPQQTMTIRTSSGARPDGGVAFLDVCLDHDPTYSMGEASTLYCSQASSNMSAVFNAVCALTRVDYGFEWPWLSTS